MILMNIIYLTLQGRMGDFLRLTFVCYIIMQESVVAATYSTYVYMASRYFDQRGPILITGIHSSSM
jgi:hypothetical protein